MEKGDQQSWELIGWHLSRKEIGANAAFINLMQLHEHDLARKMYLVALHEAVEMYKQTADVAVVAHGPSQVGFTYFWHEGFLSGDGRVTALARELVRLHGEAMRATGSAPNAQCPEPNNALEDPAWVSAVSAFVERQTADPIITAEQRNAYVEEARETVRARLLALSQPEAPGTVSGL